MSCYQSVVTFNLQVNSFGTAVNTAYPSLKRIYTFNYGQNLALLGFSFNSTIYNQSTTDLCVISLAINRQDDIIGSSDQGIIATHFAWCNTIVASSLYNPANQNTTVMFRDGYGIYVPNGTPVSMYAASANLLGNLLTGWVTLHCLLAK